MPDYRRHAVPQIGVPPVLVLCNSLVEATDYQEGRRRSAVGGDGDSQLASKEKWAGDTSGELAASPLHIQGSDGQTGRRARCCDVRRQILWIDSPPACIHLTFMSMSERAILRLRKRKRCLDTLVDSEHVPVL
jgi:hypothetical protein